MEEDGGSACCHGITSFQGGRPSGDYEPFSTVFHVLQAVYCIGQFGNHFVWPCPWLMEFLTLALWYN